MSSKTIEIAPYQPGWPDEFRALAMPLREALGSLALRIDHIGSTSVPDLDAKDIIDIQVAVAGLDADAITNALAPLGFTLRADITCDHVPAGANPDPVEWSKLYFRAPAEMRPMHLHVRVIGRLNQQYALLFRDYLRANVRAAGSYAAIKRALARLHPNDAQAYYDIKDPACDLIMEAAGMWARESGWTPSPSDA